MAPAARKPRAAPGGAPAAITEDGILARIASAGSSAGLADEVSSFLESGARVSKENQGHTRAKKVVPFLGRLLKVCSAELRKPPVDGDAVGYRRGDDLFKVMGVALDSLDGLRPWLASGVIEIELQRYGLVRRLALWKRYREAVDECRKILKSLDDRLFSSSKGGKARRSSRRNQCNEVVLPSPNSSSEVPGLPALMIGLASDLILYSVEGGERDTNVLDNMVRLPLQVEPWLSVMDSKDRGPQRDAVFKALYRSTNILIVDCGIDGEILYSFGTITLIWCSVSSQADQYLKVARKFCSGIASVCESASLEICSFVIASVRSKVELHLASQEMLEECALSTQNLGRASSDELRGLVSITYNIGVQSYNKKKYDSACKPLKLAHDGAWIRVDLLMVMSDVDVVAAVSEACSKTLAYVDCLARGSDNVENAIEVLRNSLVYWIRVHSQGFKLETPQLVLKLWCKMTLDSAPELCCLNGSLRCLDPALPAASLGLLLEEQLLVLDGTERHGIDKIKDDIIEYLADEVYSDGLFVVELSRILIEKSRIARKKGIHNLGTAIALLSKALRRAENALKANDSSRVRLAELNYYCAVIYCLRAHCSQEADPFSEDHIADIASAIKSSGNFLMFLKSGADFQATRNESLLFLLRSMADLLSLKAMTSLQDEIQLLIFEFISTWQGSVSDLPSTLWQNARTGHALCQVPLSWSFDTALQRKFGQKIDDLYNPDQSADSIIEASTLLLTEDTPDGFRSATKLNIDAALESARSTPNSFRERVYSSTLQFYLAEVFAQRGDLQTAAKLATESLQLRLKLLNRTFVVSKNDDQRASTSTFEAIGSSAVLAWPTFHRRDACYEFSQWHVLGDYMESLMQTGTLHEKLGFSDEAEKSFREGLWLAKAQNLNFANLRFASALAEVHRKQHLWDRAEECFNDAEKMLEDSNMANVCARCIVMERCQLQLRRGDFARHSPMLNKDNSKTRLDIALMHYGSAIEVSAELPSLREVLNEFDHSSSKSFDFKDTTLSSWTSYKWEYCSRRLAAQLCTEQGSCRFQLEIIRKAEQSFLKAAHLLSVQLDTPEKNSSIKTSIFPLDEASVLYNWSLLQLWEGRGERFSQVCALAQSTWLNRAFFLSTTACILFKKVCQLSAILHILDGGRDTKELAAYFHQASIGSVSRQQHQLVLDSKLQQDDAPAYLKEMRQALSVMREGSTDLRAEFESLFDGFPPATVCCISVMEQELAFVLPDHPTDPAIASLLISRIGGGDVIVTILPVSGTVVSVAESSQVAESRSKHKSVLESDAVIRSMMGELASILDESRQSTSRLLPVSTPEEKSQWWKWRTELDLRLAACLRTVETNWFGFWKCLFLGEPAQASLSDAYRKKSKEFCRTLKSKSFLGQLKARKVPEEALVKLMLQSAGSLDDAQLRHGIAFVLGWNSIGAKEESLLERASEAFRSLFSAAVAKNLIAESFEREPLELVLDGKLQALPWESLPVMRDLETYRMPSLGSIKAVYIHHKKLLSELDVCDDLRRLRLNAKTRKKVDEEQRSRPAVNPHSTFYLLNPGGDLESTQSAFEDWFRHQKGWKGKAGEVPTIDEYLAGFQQHEMFVYLGHGSGEQYFPEKHLRNLAHCPASLLMGCSSGRFSGRGDYDPVGVPLSYLMACCPLAIANLWDVTDGDIDRFSRAVLQRWLDSGAAAEAPPASVKPKTRGRRGRGSAQIEASSGSSSEWDEVCVGPSIKAGREACRLPYLIGASPVCFGVPTIIRRRKADVDDDDDDTTPAQ